MLRRLVNSVILSLMAMLLFCSAVLAAWEYFFPIIVVDTSNTTRTYYPVMLGFGGQSLVDGFKIAANGTDTNIQIGSSNISYMMSTTNVTAVVPSLPSGGLATLNLYTGYSPAQTGFPIITGSGGYVTVSDNASMEIGDNFTIEQTAYVDTASGSGKRLVYKEESFSTYVSASSNITSVIWDASANTDYDPTADGTINQNALLGGAPNAWTAMQDNNDATLLQADAGVGVYLTDLFTNIAIYTDRNDTDVISSVQVFWRNREIGDPCKGMASVYVNGSQYNGASQHYNAAWTWLSETWTLNPDDSEAWEVSDLNGFEFGFRQGEEAGGDAAETSECYVKITYFPSVDVTVGGMSSAEYTVTTTANTTHMVLTVGATSNSTALGGLSADDNANNWIFGQNDVVPYTDNITLEVDGVQQLWLAPLTMLTGTTVPDRSGNSHDGTITWGSNSNVSITYGEMTSFETYIASVNATSGFDVPTVAIPSTWFVSGGNVTALPFYDSFSAVAVQTGKPVQMYYALAIIGVAFGAFVGIAVFTRSALLAYIAMVCIFGVGSSMTIVPSWIVFSLIIIGTGIMYLYKQVAY